MMFIDVYLVSLWIFGALFLDSIFGFRVSRLRERSPNDLAILSPWDDDQGGIQPTGFLAAELGEISLHHGNTSFSKTSAWFTSWFHDFLLLKSELPHFVVISPHMFERVFCSNAGPLEVRGRSAEWFFFRWWGLRQPDTLVQAEVEATPMPWWFLFW